MVFQRQNSIGSGLLLAGVLSAALLNGSTLRTLADDDVPTAQKGTSTRSVQTLDVELSETPLIQAIAMIQKQLGSISIVFKGGDPAFNSSRVTLSLKGKPLTEVLKYVATAAGADIWNEDGIYFIGPKGSHVVAQPVQLPTEAQPFANVRVSTKLSQIHLNYADATLVVAQLSGESVPAIQVNLGQTSLAGFAGAAQTYIQRPQTDPLNSVQLVRGFNGNENAYPAAPSNVNNVPLGTRGSGSDTTAHRSEDHDYNRGGQLSPGGGGGGGFGQPGGGAGQPGQGQGQGQGQNGGAATARSLLPAGIEPADLTALSNNNVIIVRYRDDPEGEQAFRELQSRIRLLDIKPKQIQIRAQFVTVTQNDADQFGINWQFQKVNLLGVLNAGYAPTGQAILQFATGNLQTQLNFALTTGRGKVVASPMATTFNNVPAQFTNTTQYYSFIPQTFIGPGGAAQTTYFPQQIPATSALLVTPRINGDNTITLNGTLQFQDLSGTAKSPDGTDYPILVSQVTPVTRIIRNGDTMVLAGLIRKQDNTTVQKVPLLGDLPLIGSLFRSRSINTNDSELLVFITATILADPTPGGAISVGGGLPTAVGGPTGNQ